MNRKFFLSLIATLSILLLSSCNNDIDPDFSFSPEEPKAGETVTFENLSAEGKHWLWNFGDNSRSTTKNPSHIYEKPGVYNITLRVDSSNRNIKSKQITVFDTIPLIQKSVDAVKYFETFTLSALIYNPQSEDIVYDWQFSENAHGEDITDGKSSAASVEVYFSEKNITETVTLNVKIGSDLNYTVSTTFEVEDIKAKTMYIATKNDKILTKRIIENGDEAPVSLALSSGKHPFNLCVNDHELYIFDAGSNISYNSAWESDTSGDGAILVYNIPNKTVQTVIKNEGNSSHFNFFNGFVNNSYVYWTDYSEFVYRIPKSERNKTFAWEGNADEQAAKSPYYLVKTNRLGYYGKGLSENQKSGGFLVMDNGAYYWAKGANGKGLFRFQQSDILSSNSSGSEPIPSLGALFTTYSIRSFAIDYINLRIYFSSTGANNGFYVGDFHGNVSQIDNEPVDDPDLYITSIAIDNASNCVYWSYRSPETIGATPPETGSWEEYYELYPTHRTGIKCVKLANSTFVPKQSHIRYFLENVEVYGIAIYDMSLLAE